jgi:hypothetical protein
MGVVSPERKRALPRPPLRRPPPEEEPPRRRFPWGLIVLALVVLGLVAAYNWTRDLLPDFDNPFKAETIDRSGPAVLKSIQDLQDYHAASGNFELVIDLHRDTELPDEILGERTLFVAAGTVDAVVDFSSLDSGAVKVSDDRRSATIALPRPRLSDARINPERSYVYDRDRGVFNKVGALFQDNENNERELYLLAERKLLAAARSGSGLVPRAEENTEAMLESMLRSLGFTSVTVRFAPASGAADE